MQIVDFGFFRPREDDDSLILFFVNEDGQDWYDLRFGLTNWDPQTGRFLDAIYGAWVMTDADGVVTNVERDPSRLAPGERRILGIDADPADIVKGMVYRDGQLATQTREAAE